MSGRMLPVSVADWSQVIPSAEKSLDFLLRKGVAVYIKVRRDSEIVYRHYKVPLAQWERSTLPFPAFQNTRAPMPPGDVAPAELSESHPLFGLEKVDSLPCVGFLEEAAFLRLDDGALAEIAVSRSCFVSSFSGDGFLIPRPCEVTGKTRGGYSIKKPHRIEAADLARFEFDHAIIVDKKRRDWVMARTSPMEAPSPEQFAIQVEVGEKDLYVTSADFDALKQDAQQGYEVVDYPFGHSKHIPGIYWMFQAACALNDKHMIAEDEVLDWLRVRCASDVFGGKRGAFAAKLVSKELDRAKGRKGGPRPFKLGDLKNWADDPEGFTLSFLSEGLTLAVAVAEWWLERLEGDPNESRVVLAKKLYEQNFDQTEADHLVRLIAGVQLSRDEKSSLREWASDKDRKERLKSLSS